MPALRRLASVILASCALTGYAAGLGPVQSQSGLGQTLRITVAMLGEDAGALQTNCIQARLETTEGVLIVKPEVAVSGVRPAMSLLLTTRQPINEPAATLRLTAGCQTTVQRTYALLFDPAPGLTPIADAGLPAAAPAPTRKAASASHAKIPTLAAMTPRDSAHRPRSRRLSGDDASGADGITDATPMLSASSPATPARAAPAEPAHAVLRLSPEGPSDGAAAGGLRSSDTLSITGIETDARRLEELRAAQANLAAYLRGDDPLRNSEAGLASAQAEARALQQKTQQLRQQTLADAVALATARDRGFSFNWIVGLSGLLLVCLCALGWLLWRYAAMRKRADRTNWEMELAEHAATDTDLVSLLGDTQFGNTEQINQSVENLPTLIDLSQSSTLDLDHALAADPLAPKRRAGPKPPAADTPPARNLNHGNGPVDTRNPLPPEEDAMGEFVDTVPMRAGRDTPSRPAELDAIEITNLMQVAELWMSLDDPQRAIKVLEPAAAIEKPRSLAPWIYLLDLYRQTGKREQYGIIRARLERVCNMIVPAWEDQPDDAPALMLADFPDIVEAICDRWDGDEIVRFLEKLLTDSRNSLRPGFGVGVYRELVQLITLAHEPNARARQEDLISGKAHEILFGTGGEHFVEPAPDSLFSAGVQSPATPAPSALLVLPPEHHAAQPVAAIDVSLRLPETLPAASDCAAPMPDTIQPAPGTIDFTPSDIVRKPMPMVVPPEPPPPEVEPEPETLFPEIELVPQTPPAAWAKLDEPDHSAEMATKLSLAMAYQDIGEKEGACVLLEEVILGGNPEQVSQAKAMLATLGI